MQEVASTWNNGDEETIKSNMNILDLQASHKVLPSSKDNALRVQGSRL